MALPGLEPGDGGVEAGGDLARDLELVEAGERRVGAGPGSQGKSGLSARGAARSAWP